MRDRFAALLPFLFLALLAVSRWPGFLPPNFSAVYALMFCAGALFHRRGGLAVPLALLVVTDVALNFYYQFAKGLAVWTPSSLIFLSFNYIAYAGLFLVGRAVRPLADLLRQHFGGIGRIGRWLVLVSGGVMAAVLFYLITNTASWLFNPFGNSEYPRTITGWITALTTGVKGFPQAWEFFRNSLLSSGLFAALFAGAWEVTAAESPADKGQEEPATAENTPPPEESPA